MSHFSGTWLLVEVSNMDEFLKTVDVGWMVREAAKTLGYGVKKQNMEIAVEGDKLTIIAHGGTSTTTNMFTVGAGPQEITGPGGKASKITPVWEGEKLVMVQDNGMKITREISGEKLVQTMEINGVVASKTYTKQ